MFGTVRAQPDPMSDVQKQQSDDTKPTFPISPIPAIVEAQLTWASGGTAPWPVKLHPFPAGLMADQQSLFFVTNTDSDDVSVVDAVKRVETERIAVGGSPRGSVRFDRENLFGYVSNTAGNTISVIDLIGLKEVDRIEVGLAPRGLFIGPDGTHAYVSNSGDGTLSIVDLRSRKKVATVPVGQNPRHMALTADGKGLLVSLWGSDSIAVLDIVGAPWCPIRPKRRTSQTPKRTTFRSLTRRQAAKQDA